MWHTFSPKQFAADVTSTPFDAECILPITIGSVPLATSYATLAYPPPGQVITQQPTGMYIKLPITIGTLVLAELVLMQMS